MPRGYPRRLEGGGWQTRQSAPDRPEDIGNELVDRLEDVGKELIGGNPAFGPPLGTLEMRVWVRILERGGRGCEGLRVRSGRGHRRGRGRHGSDGEGEL